MYMRNNILILFNLIIFIAYIYKSGPQALPFFARKLYETDSL